jgi:hypothetical protein
MSCRLFKGVSSFIGYRNNPKRAPMEPENDLEECDTKHRDLERKIKFVT